MARFKSGHSRPTKVQAVSDGSTTQSQGWNTLEELRQMLTSKGCTKAQFEEAVETVGDDPRRVASYLQRYTLTRAPTEKINGN